MQRNYQPPQDHDAFEDLCLELLRAHWNCPTLERFGRRGQKQYGIDIIDLGGTPPYRAAQCKGLDSARAITPTEIATEVDKAKTFSQPLDAYTILTTAKNSTDAQLKVQTINHEHNQQQLFTVYLVAWDQMKRLLHQYPHVAERFYGSLSHQDRALLQRGFDSIHLAIRSLAGEKDEEEFHAEIDHGRDYVEKHEYQMARLILHRLKERSWDKLTPRHKFRLLSNLGAACLGEQTWQVAADMFLQAKVWQPEDEKACGNEALAYQLKEERGRAFESASEYRKRFPSSGRIAAVWVTNAPANMLASELAEQLPKNILGNAEVLVVLSQRAFNEDNLAAAEDFARQATAAGPSWSYPHLLLAKAAGSMATPSWKISASG